MNKLNIALITLIGVLVIGVLSYTPLENALAESSGDPEEDLAQSIYEYSAYLIDGEEISLDRFRGNILLIVNTASKCGYTDQFIGLEQIYNKYKNNNLIVLGFPCNQFGSQEPGTDEEIMNYCQTNFHITFPIFTKVEVNGRKAHPLFKYLKKNAPGLLGSRSIKWNFTKFLVDQNGKVIKRFPSQVPPESISGDIEELIKIDEKLTDLR